MVPSRECELTSTVSTGVSSGWVTSAIGHCVASTYDFSRHRRLLDLGGGNGTFGGELLGRNEGLRSTLVELPSVAVLARQRLASHPCRDRFEVVDCDLTSDEIPADGHDVALLANVVHVFTPDQNRTLLARLRAAVEPGTRLLLVDTWTNPDRSSPLQAALISGEYLVTNGGQAYSIPEAQAWLRDAGWTSVEHREILGITGPVMAEAG